MCRVYHKTHKRKTLQSYPEFYRINIISANFDIFYLFLPFAGRYFFIHHSLYTKFCVSSRRVRENVRSLVTRHSFGLVSRPITKRHVERLEVENCSRTKSGGFVVVLREKKLFENDQSLCYFCL